MQGNRSVPPPLRKADEEGAGERERGGGRLGGWGRSGEQTRRPAAAVRCGPAAVQRCGPASEWTLAPTTIPSPSVAG